MLDGPPGGPSCIQHSTLNIPHSTFRLSPPRPRHPPTPKPCPLHPPHDVGIPPHRPPDEATAGVLDHGDDGALVDTEIVDVEPAELRVDAAVLELLRAAQRRVEGVDEAVVRVEVRAVA